MNSYTIQTRRSNVTYNSLMLLKVYEEIKVSSKPVLEKQHKGAVRKGIIPAVIEQRYYALHLKAYLTLPQPCGWFNKRYCAPRKFLLLT